MLRCVSGPYSAGLFGEADPSSGSGWGVYGLTYASDGASAGVTGWAWAGTGDPIGTYGYSAYPGTGVGTFGQFDSESATGSSNFGFFGAGVWGDGGSDSAGVGVGSADDNNAGVF